MMLSISADSQSALSYFCLKLLLVKQCFNFTDTHWVCFDVMNLFGLWPVLSVQSDCSLPFLFMRSTLCFRRFLLSVYAWGRHALSVLQPTCGLQSDRRLISSQGLISLHDSISTKDSAILGADCSVHRFAAQSVAASRICPF